uniref:Uncharacterized protein n=1 Tax=Spongospora subterranea TaxID=70186 RepID=A0A0H5QTM2_9EUKA|eukprot:CRZ04911.1 hypothetical protein [Spongospora subterranea]
MIRSSPQLDHNPSMKFSKPDNVTYNDKRRRTKTLHFYRARRKSHIDNRIDNRREKSNIVNVNSARVTIDSFSQTLLLATPMFDARCCLIRLQITNVWKSSNVISRGNLY